MRLFIVRWRLINFVLNIFELICFNVCIKSDPIVLFLNNNPSFLPNKYWKNKCIGLFQMCVKASHLSNKTNCLFENNLGMINSQIVSSNWVFMAIQVVVVLIVFGILIFICYYMFASDAHQMVKTQSDAENAAHTNMATIESAIVDEEEKLEDAQSKSSTTPLTKD